VLCALCTTNVHFLRNARRFFLVVTRHLSLVTSGQFGCGFAALGSGLGLTEYTEPGLAEDTPLRPLEGGRFERYEEFHV
jgi:hypothetical protein